MNTLRVALATVLLLGLAGGGALAASLADAPGYVDLEWIEIPDTADEIHDIDLSPVLLDMAKDAEEEGDTAMAQALTMVHSIRVKSWSLDDEGNTEAEAAVTKVTGFLKNNDWKRLIYVKDHDETVAVSTRYVDEDLVGLMLVMYEPGDSVAFVNVVGDLDLGTLFKLAAEMDSDDLEDMLDEIEDAHDLDRG